jgi:hypothetical protein
MTRKDIVTFALILSGLAIVILFGLRTFHDLRRFKGHHPPPSGKVETDVELIRDWMTVPFISRMYHVHEEILFDALNVPPGENRDKSLKVLNQEFHPDQDGFVMDLVKATILVHQPPPAADSAPTPASP